MIEVVTQIYVSVGCTNFNCIDVPEPPPPVWEEPDLPPTEYPHHRARPGSAPRQRRVCFIRRNPRWRRGRWRAVV